MVSQSTKTSSRRRRTRTTPRARTLGAPRAPACLAIQDATQGVSALARTELLLRHGRPQREENIAARPLARLPDKIFRIRGWALARARRGRLQLRCLGRCGRFPSYLLLDAAQCGLPARRPLLPLPFPVAARLLPTTLLPGLTGPVKPRAPPAPPARGLLPAGHATKPLLRLDGLERLFTTLEQALAMPATYLSPSGRGPILTQAHGSRQLPGSSLAAELLLRREAFLLSHRDWSPAYRRGR
jgi:hypothetical protein